MRLLFGVGNIYRRNRCRGRNTAMLRHGIFVTRHLSFLKIVCWGPHSLFAISSSFTEANLSESWKCMYFSPPVLRRGVRAPRALCYRFCDIHSRDGFSKNYKNWSVLAWIYHKSINITISHNLWVQSTLITRALSHFHFLKFLFQFLFIVCRHWIYAYMLSQDMIWYNNNFSCCGLVQYCNVITKSSRRKAKLHWRVTHDLLHRNSGKKWG